MFLKMFDIMRRNRIYLFFLFFILGVNLLAYMRLGEVRSSEATKTVVPDEAGEKKDAAVEAEGAVETAPARPEEKKRMFIDGEEVRARQEKLEKLAGESPKLYFFLVVLNLTLVFIVFAGIMLDGYFVSRWLRKKPVRIKVIESEPPRWTIGDVVRAALIFLFWGYAFVIVQGFVLKYFPLLRNENFSMVFNTAIVNIVGISVILHFVKKKYSQSVAALGLSSRKLPVSIAYAGIGYLALIPIIVVIMTATFLVTKSLGYSPPVQPIVQAFMEEKQTSVLWASMLFAALFGPVAEEIFFRGFMYPAVKKKFGVFWGMVGTSVLFSGLHAHAVGFAPIMALGLLLVYLREKTGSLVPSIAVHMAHNLGMLMLVFLMRLAE